MINFNSIIYITTHVFNFGTFVFCPSNLANAAWPAILASSVGSCLFGKLDDVDELADAELLVSLNLVTRTIKKNKKKKYKDIIDTANNML